MLLKRLLLALIVTTSLYSCRNQDSEVSNPEIDGLLALAENIQYTQSDTALVIVRQALEKSHQLEYLPAVGTASKLMGSLLYQMGGLGPAIEHLNKALNIYEQLDNPLQQAEINLLLAKVYQRSGHPNQAFLYLHRAQNLFQVLNNQNGMAQVYGNLGHFYEKSQQYDSALHYQKKALKLH